MKIKKQLGSDSVKDVVDAATQRASEISHEETVRDPWPSSRHSLASDAAWLSTTQVRRDEKEE
jgi:hypothetical protein